MKTGKLPKGTERASGLVLRRRRKPGGRPFQPANNYGKATRFAKGVSGNPGGRPAFKAISESIRWMLAQPLSEAIIPQTRAEVIALGAIREASKRKLGFVAEVCDRAEGRPAVAIAVQSEDPLSALLAEVRQMSTQLGAPEGTVKQEESEP